MGEKTQIKQTDFVMSYALFHMFCAMLSGLSTEIGRSMARVMHICVGTNNRVSFRHKHMCECVSLTYRTLHISYCVTGTIFQCVHIAFKEFPILRNTKCILYKHSMY